MRAVIINLNLLSSVSMFPSFFLPVCFTEFVFFLLYLMSKRLYYYHIFQVDAWLPQIFFLHSCIPCKLRFALPRCIQRTLSQLALKRVRELSTSLGHAILSILLQFIPGEILTNLNTVVGWSRAIGQQTVCCFVDRFVFASGI